MLRKLSLSFFLRPFLYYFINKTKNPKEKTGSLFWSLYQYALLHYDMMWYLYDMMQHCSQDFCLQSSFQILFLASVNWLPTPYLEWFSWPLSNRTLLSCLHSSISFATIAVCTAFWKQPQDRGLFYCLNHVSICLPIYPMPKEPV